jgi:hypothetical protein
MSGTYLLLYKYLQCRYADTVVLTFEQIESLLGFALPDQPRLNQQWWTNVEVTAAGTNYADSWLLASRIATPKPSGRDRRVRARTLKLLPAGRLLPLRDPVT